tara:strand:- start:200 stop:556 length:357 start_codon:yes stop_codon:yes gene_type:complete
VVVFVAVVAIGSREQSNSLPSYGIEGPPGREQCRVGEDELPVSTINCMPRGNLVYFVTVPILEAKLLLSRERWVCFFMRDWGSLNMLHNFSLLVHASQGSRFGHESGVNRENAAIFET